MSIFWDVIRNFIPSITVSTFLPGFRRPLVAAILPWAAPWATSATAALNELRGMGLGYNESDFRADWATLAPKFRGVESQTPFEQRYPYYYTAYLKDAEGNKYRENLAHYSDVPLTRQELRDKINESWEDESERGDSPAFGSVRTPYLFRVRGTSVKTGWLGTRPL